jgi:hypothetical protein
MSAAAIKDPDPLPADSRDPCPITRDIRLKAMTLWCLHASHCPVRGEISSTVLKSSVAATAIVPCGRSVSPAPSRPQAARITLATTENAMNSSRLLRRKMVAFKLQGVSAQAHRLDGRARGQLRCHSPLV